MPTLDDAERLFGSPRYVARCQLPRQPNSGRPPGPISETGGLVFFVSISGRALTQPNEKNGASQDWLPRGPLTCRGHPDREARHPRALPGCWCSHSLGRRGFERSSERRSTQSSNLAMRMDTLDCDEFREWLTGDLYSGDESAATTSSAPPFGLVEVLALSCLRK